MSKVFPNSIIKYDELPTINGELIESIFAYKWKENYYKAGDCPTGEKPDFFLCQSYFRCHTPHYSRRVRTLPEVFQKLLLNADGTYKGRYLSYRTRCSGNGGFVDESISLNGDGKHVAYYRGSNDEMGILEKSEIAQLMIFTLNKKYKCEEVGDYEFTPNPCTHLRNEGGLFYPDVACSGWRWMHGMPYVSNNYPKRENIRVFNEYLNAHMYLQKVNSVEVGDEDLLTVDFPFQDDKRGDLFCNPSRWNDTRNNELIRYKILHKKREKNVFEVGACYNGEVQFKKEMYGDSFYKIVSIIFID